MFILQKIRRTVLLFFLFFFPVSVWGWTPPVDSPLAKAEHPRLLLISDSFRASNPGAFGFTVSEMRSKLVSHADYKTEFQRFVNDMDSVFNTAVSSKSKMDSTYDAINYAFLYILDPSILSAPPFMFNFAHTKDQYGSKAIEHAVHIANQAKQVSSNSKNSGIDYVPVYYSGNSFEGTTNISLAIVNDWVNDKVTKSQKQLFMDALLNIFSFKMDMDAFASAVHFGNNQNGDAGMLGFYGDDIDNAGQTYYKDQLDVLMNAFNTNWIKGWAELLNKVYDEGSSSIQGPSYGELAARNMMPMALIMSTAMGTNYISEVSYLRDYGFYDLYFTLPMPYSGVYYPLYTDDSSLIKKTKAYGKNKIIFKPLMYGLQLENPDLASLLKWYWEKSGIFIEKNSSNLRWYMIYDLILGTKNLSPKNPSEVGLPLSKRIGNGEYALRTGFTDPNDTLIAFFATKYHTNDGAHAHRDFGSFRIFKHGRLAITRSIAKGFPGGGSAATEDNMFYNTIGVYRPGEDNYKGWFNLMGYRRGFNNRSIDPDHVDWGIGGRNNVGLVLHDDLNGGEYDYIHYDYTNSWAASGSYVQKVDVAHREFLYLRSAGGKNDEFVVIFDRVNSVNSTYKKYFLLHSSFEPKLFNNATQVSMAAENYPNDGDGAGGGRWVKKTSSPARDNIIEITNTFNGSHGRLYSKTLLPSSFQINKTGGPGHYWEDAEGKLIKTKENMNDKTKDFRGTFTMQVESKTGQKFDNFLNVMQIGDSNTLVSMTPVEKISATGGNGNMAGALIKDSNKNRVVLFNSSNPSIVGSIKPNIEYTLSTTAPSSHVLFNTSPNTLYSIKRNGVELLNFQSSGGGVVKFEDPTAGESVTYLVELGGSSLEEYPSEPQRQIEVQTLSGPERVRLTWYQSKDDTLNGNVNYTIYYDTSPSFGSPATISSPVITTKNTSVGRKYIATFSPPDGAHYYYKIASAWASSGKESSLDFINGVSASFSTPSITFFSVADQISGNTLKTKNSVIDVNASATDPQGSGTITRWLIKETGGRPSVAAMNTGLTSPPTTYTISGQEGNVDLYLWVMDNDQNISLATTASKTSIIYSVPPATPMGIQVK